MGNDASVLAEYLTRKQLEELKISWIEALDNEEDRHIETINEAIKIVEGEWL